MGKYLILSKEKYNVPKENQKYIVNYSKQDDKVYYYIPSPIAVWKASNKNNESNNKNILEDLTGNRYNITLNNFSFSGMNGGYNGYPQDFRSIVKNDLFEGTITESSAKINWISNERGSWVRFYSYTNINWTLYLDECNGISPALLFLKKGYWENEVNYGYIKSIKLQLGENTIPFIEDFDENYTKEVFFDCNGFREGYYFKIHIEPLYPGGLIFDGVDDYGICKNLPYLEDFTIIVKRSYDYNTSNFSGSIISKSVGYKQGEFLFEFKDIEQNNLQFLYSYGNEIEIDKFESSEISWMTPTSYNGKEILKGNNSTKGSNLTLGTIREGDARYSKFIFYELHLFNISLSRSEIKQYIKHNL